MSIGTTRKHVGTPKYKIPGYWRRCELQRKLNDELGLGYDTGTQQGMVNLRSWFAYQVRIGNIPKGFGTTSVVKGSQGKKQMWTDAQVKKIITDLRKVMSDQR